MSFISWALETATFSRRPSEQEPLLQHASIPDALEESREPPLGEAGESKVVESFALKLPAVMYSWFTVGINTASIGVSGNHLSSHFTLLTATRKALLPLVGLSPDTVPRAQQAD